MKYVKMILFIVSMCLSVGCLAYVGYTLYRTTKSNRVGGFPAAPDTIN